MDSMIKLHKPLTHVYLKDGRVLYTDATPEAIAVYIDDHTHIVIEGELHSKCDIVSSRVVIVDTVETFILSQPERMRHQLRTKQIWLRERLGKEMDLSYAQNYVKEHS